MQGTVKHYDPETRTGSILTDDRTEIQMDGRSIDTEHLLMLRFGQRVKFRVAEEEGRQIARSVQIVTFA